MKWPLKEPGCIFKQRRLHSLPRMVMGSLVLLIQNLFNVGFFFFFELRFSWKMCCVAFSRSVKFLLMWQPDQGPMVPIFGDWDESNPASADGYSHIFEKVREDKQIGAGKVPAMATESSYSNSQRQSGNTNRKVSVF